MPRFSRFELLVRGPIKRRGVRPGRRARRQGPSAEALEGRALPSLAFDIRYDYDATSFFDTPAKRALMQQAADLLAAALDDHLAAIVPSAGRPRAAGILDPASGALRTVEDLTVPEDTIVVYVGGRDLGGRGPAFSSTVTFLGGDPAWRDLVKGRGRPGALSTPPTAYAPWGGSIAFDTRTAPSWNYGSAADGIGKVDFVTVAMHQLGQILGLGNSPAWERYVTPGGFVGPASEAAFGGRPVPLDFETGPGLHWGRGVLSDGAPAVMGVQVPIDRVVFGSLDYAALQDIGWAVRPLPRVQFASHGPPGFGQAIEVGEADGAAVIPVFRLGDPSVAVTMHYATAVSTDAVRGAAAIPGIDYRPIAGELAFAPGETTKEIVVPVAHDGSGRSKVFRILLSAPPTDALIGSNYLATATIRNRATGDTTPPLVLGARVTDRRKSPALVLTFSEALDRARAEDPTRYSVQVRRRGRPRALRIASARYDPTAHALTLRLARRSVLSGRELLVTVGGTAPRGVVDVAGNLVDGDRDGIAGGDARLTVRRGRPRRG